jgi:hypothetical protein
MSHMVDRSHRSRLSVAATSLGSALVAGAVLLVPAPVSAQGTPSVSVGAGLQTQFLADMKEDEDAVYRANMRSLRLYFSGRVNEKVTFMVNTEYDSSAKPGNIAVMDAAAQISFSPKFNVWAGRFLPPSDRANLYGPYYANHWGVFSDGVQDGYPFIFQGRDEGVMYWGQFSKVKLSGGIFDGPTSTGDDTLLSAGRMQVDFWDSEDGYYLNGTYYGAKNLLAIGLAGQMQGSEKTAFNVDFLLEKKVGSNGAFTIEAQYNKYDALGGYDGNYTSSDGAYVLAAYLFPAPGTGRFQILGKYAAANFSEGLTPLDPDYDQKTTELNLNYLFKAFNGRVMLFFQNTDFSAVKQSGNKVGVGLQIQM